MRLRVVFAVVTGIAFLLTVSTQDLRAATAADPGPGDKIHVVTSGELHDSVVASSAEVAKARKSIQDFLARPEIRTQIERMGFEPEAVSSRVALLSDSDLLRLQSQVMTADQQMRTAGMPTWGIVLITVCVVLIILVIVFAVTWSDSFMEF